ncbi:hypothetical protein BDZ89DRAFT_1170603 [Hymenopellis radicata]|nr:hypothetical protein BDZ89DRAFT_1170603 [Hymenopellis radicata]
MELGFMASLGLVGYDLVFGPGLSCICRERRPYRRCARAASLSLAAWRTVIVGRPCHTSISDSSRLDADTHELSSLNTVTR